MSLVTLGKNGRVYRRKFDHEEARRRYEAGEAAAALAHEYGVAVYSVLRVVSTGTTASYERYQESLKTKGRCDDCGKPMNQKSRYRGSTRCGVCAGLARATTVRKGALLCVTCRKWKPDEDFSRSTAAPKARRGRHQQCRACNTKTRQDYRERQKVPCVGCGKLVLPPGEKGERGAPWPRCLACANRGVTPNTIVTSQASAGRSSGERGRR